MFWFSSASERDVLRAEVDTLKRTVLELESAAGASKDREGSIHKEVRRVDMEDTSGKGMPYGSCTRIS